MKPIESQGHAPRVVSFFDPDTYTGTHVVIDEGSKQCAIVDCVLDYDPKSGMTSTASADALIAWVRGEELTVDWILETHVHADHLSAAPYLQEALGGKTAIGSAVTVVQGVFKGLFNVEDSFPTDGSQFDVLFDDGAAFSIGELTCQVLHTPGHTPACVTYAVGDALFVGDTLFAPDYGTARCDFPGGDAKVLFQSVKKLLAFPPETRIFLCHDYLPGGRELQLETSVAAERESNIHVHEGVDEASFVTMRTERDATL
ncbi:MAG: MBL fold metallo-hydrolase, partial [Pseudomonadales bacterium]